MRQSEVTPAQAERASLLLRTSWRLGVISEEGDVQYRGAMHPPSAAHPTEHRGVEVWTSRPASTATPVVTAPSVSDADRDAVLEEGAKRGWPRDELNAAISIESGWNPAAHNPQGFGGLIGFSPSLAKRYAGSKERLWAMSVREQAPLVGRYFDDAGVQWRRAGDTYMALAAPAFIRAPDDTIVYARGTKAWEQNPGWRGPDGEIRSASIRAVLFRKMARIASGKGATVAVPKAPPAGSSGSAWLSYLLASCLHDFERGRLATFGPSLTTAVEALQNELEVTPDGKVGPLTVGAIRKKGWSL